MSLENYREHLIKHFLKSKKMSKQKLKTLEKGISSFTHRLSTLYEKEYDEQQHYKFLSNVANSERIKEQYAAMQKMIGRGIYKKINFNNGTCIAETGKCYISFRLQQYFVGRFKIKIEKNRIQYTNLDYEYPSHPHIGSSGACYGNIGLALIKILGKKEYPIALELIYRFLNSFNNKDAITTIDSENWHWKKEMKDEKRTSAEVI